MRKIFGIIIIIMVSTVMFNCKRSPDVINVNYTNLFPEGIAYDSGNKRFLLSSITMGSIFEVSLKGEIKQFISNKKLFSSIGIRINPKNNLLYVCNSDVGASPQSTKKTNLQMSQVGIFSLKTGKEIAFVDLASLTKGGSHFCNDIAFDAEGNAYVTDSFSPIIYKINTKFTASIFVEDKRFEVKGFGLNGIVYHNSGFLLAGHSRHGKLYKILLDGANKISEVSLPQKVIGADGLGWLSNGNLSIITGGKSNTVFVLKSKKWDKAEIVKTMKTGDVYPTTGTAKCESYYIVYSYINKLLAKELPFKSFKIIKLK